jgi:tetratricopeptide (TPR) repeat protein
MSRHRRYDDFVVRFGGRSADRHEVSTEGHGRQGSGTFTPPLGAREVQGLFERIAGRNLAASPAAVEPPLAPRDAGERLFAALMQGELRRLFEQSLLEARLRGRALRVVVKADPRQPDRAAVLALPWELLYHPGDRRFLALDRRHSVVRFAELPAAPNAAPARALLRVLVAAACPRGLPRLEVERELEHVRSALRGTWHVRAEFLAKARLEAVRERLLAGRHRVLHVVGHGDHDEATGEGRLLFEGEDGEAEPVSGEELAGSLSDLTGLGLVVLNACATARLVAGGGNPFAGVATALVRAGVPRVLAMQAPITDRAAIAFSRAFYRRLAAGDPVDAAAVEGRFAIVGASRRRLPGRRTAAGWTAAEERPEWAIPALFLRADGALRQPLPWRRLSVAAVCLLALLVGLARAVRAREIRLQVGDFDVRSAASPADDLTGAGLRDALLQKLSAVASRPRIRVACLRCPEVGRELASPLEVDYFLEGELRLGERPEVVAEIHDREALLLDEPVVVRSAPGAGLDLLALAQELALGVLDRLDVQLDPRAVAALASIPTGDGKAFELNNEGAALLFAGDLAAAESTLRAALAADPGFAAAAANLAELEARRGNYDAALAGYRAAIERLPGYAVFHFDLGYLLLHRRPGDAAAGAAAAIPSFERAVELDPGYAQAHNELGNALLELGRLGAAGQAFERAAAIAPDAPQPHKNLARLALAEGRPRDALADLDEALRRLPVTDRLGRMEVLAWVVETQASLGEGAEVCRAAAALERLDPERVSPWWHQAGGRAEQWGCRSGPGDLEGAPP